MYYLHNGQYRKVESGHDGEATFQCMWCKRTIVIFDNPDYWNFCPLCGKSWFKRMECRPRYHPRWHWERYGHECNGPSWYGKRVMPTSEWVIECRTKWFDDPWGEWEFEYAHDKDPCKPDWQWARSTLQYHRERHDRNDTGIQWEYRAYLRKKT